MINVGAYYENKTDRSIAYVWRVRNNGLAQYASFAIGEGGDNTEVDVREFLKDWTLRGDLKDWPNAKDPLLSYDFDLLFDMKRESSLIRAIEEHSEILRVMHENRMSYVGGKLVKTPVAFAKSSSLECSTSHISKKDSEVLTEMARNGSSSTVSEYREGFFILIPHDFNEFNQNGLSEAFINLCANARDLGCEHLHLDAEAETYEDLPQFSW